MKKTHDLILLAFDAEDVADAENAVPSTAAAAVDSAKPSAAKKPEAATVTTSESEDESEDFALLGGRNLSEVF